jgi:hypothetical protein
MEQPSLVARWSVYAFVPPFDSKSRRLNWRFSQKHHFASTLEKNMLSLRSLIVAAALGACGFGLTPSLASAQAAGPSNALQYTFQSIDELRDEARAQAGWHKSHWQCQPGGPCVWVAGFWGPPPASSPPGAYVYVRPFGSVGWSGYYPAPPY